MKKTLSLILLCLMPGAIPVYAQDIDAAQLYHDYCSVCHGDNGDGEFAMATTATAKAWRNRA
jgi:mono/diheme cytochrome c family protein